MATVLLTLRNVCTISAIVISLMLAWVIQPVLAQDANSMLIDTNNIASFASTSSLDTIFHSENVWVFSLPIDNLSEQDTSESSLNWVCANGEAKAWYAPSIIVLDNTFRPCEPSSHSMETAIVVGAKGSDASELTMFRNPDVSGIDIELGDMDTLFLYVTSGEQDPKHVITSLMLEPDVSGIDIELGDLASRFRLFNSVHLIDDSVDWTEYEGQIVNGEVGDYSFSSITLVSDYSVDVDFSYVSDDRDDLYVSAIVSDSSGTVLSETFQMTQDEIPLSISTHFMRAAETLPMFMLAKIGVVVLGLCVLTLKLFRYGRR